MNAKEVKEIRNHLGLSREEFAKRLGVSVRTIYNYENGGIIPSTKKEILHLMKRLIIEEDGMEKMDKLAELAGLIKDNNEEEDSVPRVVATDEESYREAIKAGLSLVPEREVFFRGGERGETNGNAPVLAYWHIPGVSSQAEIISIEGNSMHPILPAGSKAVITPLPFDPREPTSIPFGSIFGIAVEDDTTGEWVYYVKYLRRHKDGEQARRYWIARSANSEDFDDFDIPIDRVRRLWLVDTIIQKFR